MEQDHTDFKSLVCDIIFLLLDETSFVKYSPPGSPGSRFQQHRRNTAAPRNSRHDRWTKLDALLFPYMIYNLKTYSAMSKQSARARNMIALFATSNIESEAACAHATDLLELVAENLRDNWTAARPQTDKTVPGDWCIKYRRLAKTRLQACCSIPITDSDNAGLDFTWETFNSQELPGSNPVWKLRKFGFSDSDDEEYYWRPWELTLQEAETDYLRFQHQDYKAELAPLDVRDLDWDVATTNANSVSTHSDPETLSNYTWSIYESAGGIFGGAGAAAKLAKQAANPRSTTTTATRAAKPGKAVPGRALTRDTHIYNHHNDYTNPDPDYEEDYSYNQAHPVFKHGVVGLDDDDDLFGVCHGMAEQPKQQPVATKPHLQRIIGGDHDSEAAYWDQYDDEVEY